MSTSFGDRDPNRPVDPYADSPRYGDTPTAETPRYGEAPTAETPRYDAGAGTAPAGGSSALGSSAGSSAPDSPAPGYRPPVYGNDDYPPPGQAYDQGYGQGYPPPAAQGYGGPAYGGQGYGGPAYDQPKRNGLGVAALVLGILALLGTILVVPGILLGLIAVVLGFLGRSRAKKGSASNGGMALAGLLTGAAAVILSAALGALIAAGAVGFLNSDTGQQLQDCLRNAGNDTAAVRQCQVDAERNLQQR